MPDNIGEGAEAKDPRDNSLSNLFAGLVGSHCVSTVSAGGTGCQSVLDTRSQVTTISDTF